MILCISGRLMIAGSYKKGSWEDYFYCFCCVGVAKLLPLWMIYPSSSCCLVLTAALKPVWIRLSEGMVVSSTASSQTCVCAIMRAADSSLERSPGGDRVTLCQCLELLWYNLLCQSSLCLQRPWWRRTAVKTMCERCRFVSDLGVVMKCGDGGGFSPVVWAKP